MTLESNDLHGKPVATVLTEDSVKAVPLELEKYQKESDSSFESTSSGVTQTEYTYLSDTEKEGSKSKKSASKSAKSAQKSEKAATEGSKDGKSAQKSEKAATEGSKDGKSAPKSEKSASKSGKEAIAGSKGGKSEKTASKTGKDATVGSNTDVESVKGIDANTPTSAPNTGKSKIHVRLRDFLVVIIVLIHDLNT